MKSIGIFDSGFGGIDILRGIVKELPQYNYLYLGDTARNPYGPRSSEVVHEFTKQAIDFMFRNGCELIILACNTASSDALRQIQEKYLPVTYPDKKVLGVLIPAAEEAAKETRNLRVGVIATEGTVNSGTFPIEIHKINPGIKVFQQACPLLVPLVEAHEWDTEVTEIILKKYLQPLKDKDIDTLVLGCTHYGILEEKVRHIAGPSINVVSEARVVPIKLRSYLARHPEIERKLGKEGHAEFYSTDLTGKFDEHGSRFFGRKIKAKKASLD